MKHFNLEEYLRLKEEGKEPRIVTREGKQARIVCTDSNCLTNFPILALINHGVCEQMELYDTYGRYNQDGVGSKYDLLFADLNEEPKYRPFKDAEEFFAEMKKHGEWILDDKGVFVRPLEIHNDKIFTTEGINRVVSWTFADMVEDAIWADDGSPCGVKEE